MGSSLQDSVKKTELANLPKKLQSGWMDILWPTLAALAATSMWFYVDRILVGHQLADAAEHERPRGNLSDLYPRWLGARELLLRGRNPYGPEITLEIQQGYYGRALDPSRPNEPKDQQGFAYPVYVVFPLAPLIGLSFHTVQIIFHWLLLGLTAASVLLWLRVLRWQPPLFLTAIGIALTLGSVPAVQGVKLQQLSLLVAALLAASAASMSCGFLFLGGVILALATIKPQLSGPMVVWMLIWAASDWRKRRSFAVGFAATMVALLIGSEIVLPGWWRMFWEAIRQYHQYTQNQSILDQLVNWLLGPYCGQALAVLAVLAGAVPLSKLRREAADSGGFGRAVALTMALTLLIVPMFAPYNQVMLLPAVLLLIREGRVLIPKSRVLRFVYAVAGFCLAWQWIASLGLSLIWFVSPEQALNGWKVPFYATFAFPVLVFALAVRDAQYPSRVLRASVAAE
jgi:hypothetical protein